MRPSLPLYLVVLLIIAFSGCSANDEGQHSLSYEEEIEQTRVSREETLIQPDGWLSLAGLFWLQEGDNTFGSEPTNDLVFPAGTPPQMGNMKLERGQVQFESYPGVDILSGNEPVDQIRMYSDVEGSPTILSYGFFSWYVIDRDGRLGIRLKDSSSEALATFKGLDYFPVDPSWRIEARFEAFQPPKTIPVPTILGTVRPQTSAGAIVFQREGELYRLDVVGEPGQQSYFVIFGDLTNGKETYSAGRFLDVDSEDEDGKIVIDFNKAYNPPCVFSPYATCPYPPAQNRLSLRVESGEKMYAHHE